MFVDDAREVRGSYQDVGKDKKTKTANAAITDAAYQVTLATHAIVEGHYRNFQQKNTQIKPNFYIPIIVTTANLYLCEYNPEEVSIEYGEIPFAKVNIRPVERLFYEYPIPPHLQIDSGEWWLTDRPKDFEKFIRRHILVTNSRNFDNTINWLKQISYLIPEG